MVGEHFQVEAEQVFDPNTYLPKQDHCLNARHSATAGANAVATEGVCYMVVTYDPSLVEPLGMFRTLTFFTTLLLKCIQGEGTIPFFAMPYNQVGIVSGI